MKPEEFLDKILPAARATQAATGIPASFTIAQAALESFWGQLALGNNLFGVKADSSWHGPTVSFRTTEHIDGADVHPIGKFRAYPSWQACMDDHAAFLKENGRYASCFHEKTGEGWARAVAAAGYATDPDYAKKLVAIIHGRNLTRFDQPEGVSK
jgi:flagellar protein FlgJ